MTSAAQHATTQRVADLNAKLESTVATLTRIMEIHRRLCEIVADTGEIGIAETLHQLTGFPVLIEDARGNTRAAVGCAPGDYFAMAQSDRRHLIHRLRTACRAIYHRQGWLVLASPRSDVVGIIVLVDRDRTASEIDLAALEYAATVLSVELARLQSVAEAELRSLAASERDVAQARVAELAAIQTQQRAILEAAHDAVISVDRWGRITYVNTAFERIFEYESDEVVGREVAETVVPPELRDKHRQGFGCCLATGQSALLNRRVEMTAMRADGREFPAEVTMTRIGPAERPAFICYVRDITERQRAERELRASRARLVAASDTARQRVTRDLHDGAQQWFVSTLINLQLAEQNWESAPEAARELLGLAARDARCGIADLRQLAAGIHPAVLSQRGLAAAMTSLAAQLPIAVQVEVPHRRLPEAIERSVYFFCSEALTNVVKHAHASCAWVRVELDGPKCVLQVRDDGVGGARPRSETSGLNGLADRIGALGGTMEISSPPADGTVLLATIPLPSEHGNPA